MVIVIDITSMVNHSYPVIISPPGQKITLVCRVSHYDSRMHLADSSLLFTRSFGRCGIAYCYTRRVDPLEL